MAKSTLSSPKIPSGSTSRHSANLRDVADVQIPQRPQNASSFVFPASSISDRFCERCSLRPDSLFKFQQSGLRLESAIPLPPPSHVHDKLKSDQAVPRSSPEVGPSNPLLPIESTRSGRSEEEGNGQTPDSFRFRCVAAFFCLLTAGWGDGGS